MMLVSAVFFIANVMLVRALGQVETVNVWLASCARFVVGLAMVSVMYRREFKASRLFTQPKLISRGIVGGLTVCGYYLTIVHLGAGRATFINNMYIIFGGMLAVVMLGERFHRTLALGSTAALIGLALLTNAFASGAGLGVYDIVGVLVAFGASYVVVTIRQLHATEHTSTIFAAQCAYGLLLCVVPALLHPTDVTLFAWGMMTLAGVCAAGAQIAMTYGFLHLPVAEGALLQMLVPLGVAVGGVVFFHEHFAPHELVGAALILGGTAVTALRR